MKAAATHALDHSPLPEYVVEQMRDYLSSDLSTVITAIHERFQGQRVPWDKSVSGRRILGVRQFVLENTAAMPFETTKIRSELKRLGRLVERGTYAFPPRVQ
jgi:hypothetical protein